MTKLKTAQSRPTRAESVATTLAALTDQNFKFLMDRFDRIEKQNDEQLKLLGKHVDDDAKVHAMVERHSTYFSILTLGVPVGIAAFLNKMGWK
jgi:hypothetical protein